MLRWLLKESRMRSSVVSYLSLGSNLGTREDNILEAASRIKALEEVKLLDLSSLYESQPQGMETENTFMNAACKIEASCTAVELLRMTQSIEARMGRIRESGSRDRIIDIDIVLFGDEEMSGRDLVVPHPRLRERLFVLIPLMELEPSIKLPPDGMLIRDALKAAGDEFWVRRISGRMNI